MENIDYKLALLEIISMIKDKSTYVTNMPIDLYHKDVSFCNGQQWAYHHILSGIIDYIKYSEEMRLEDFGLENLDVNEVMNYKPKGIVD